ncbi:MAG: flagellar basal-body MS-ring/collar protein FliF [Polaromonas sp.]|nr:flagellar basal-body MS-ring/collar protein FliF [Polaromonas sp.]
MATSSTTLSPNAFGVGSAAGAVPALANGGTLRANPSDAANTFAGGGGAMVTTGSGPFAIINQTMMNPNIKKALPFMVMAIVLLLFVAVYTAVNAPTYRPIVAGMTEADQQLAFDALKTAAFNPVLDTTNGQITVPSKRYHEARIFLASKGLPKTGQSGMDSLKDQSSMTTSQFMEQVRYTAAIEQELVRSILQIDSIAAARVHLALAKQSAFVRDRTPPKASVVVTPQPGRMMTPSQVQAVVHLVASSVPLLTPDNVAVVDNLGKLITDSATDSALGLTSAQTQHKQKMEEVYRQRVNQILMPIAGDANVRSQVNLQLDFSQTEVTTEDFDTRDKGPKTRSEVLSEDRNTSKDAAGIPGALSNTPPPAPAAAPNAAAAATPPATDDKSLLTNRSTRNYELDRSVRHVKSATGTVERLSVAVVINERQPTPQPKNDKGETPEAKANLYTPEEMERMQSLVRSVVGFNEARGDVVTVIPARFEAEPVFDMSVVWYKDEVLMNQIKSGVIGLVFVAFLLLVVRPAVMHLLGREQAAAEAAATLLIEQAKPMPDGELSAADMNAIQLGEGETLEQLKAKLKPKKSNISLEMLDTANSYDDKVALVRMIVAEDSARVASVLKNMIKVG